MPALRSKISLAAILIFILLLVLANNVPGPSHLGVTSAHVLARSPERQWLDYNVTSQGQWVTEQDNVTSSGKWVMGDDNVTSPGKWVIRDDNVTVHVGDTNHPHDFPYLINPEDSCEDNPPFLLILVLSKTSNREQRRAIRDTWGLLQLQRALNFMMEILPGGNSSIRIEVTSTVKIDAKTKRHLLTVSENYRTRLIHTLVRPRCADCGEDGWNKEMWQFIGMSVQPVTSARVDRRILRQAVAAPQATFTAILQHVQDTLDHSISTRTISRRLVANGLHSCRPLRRLPLTPPNRRQRLEWCRARSTWMTEWHRVVFSDESRFCLSSDSRRVRVWRRRGERSNPAAIVERPTVRQREIMVWGAIAYDSRSPLLRIQGTMTAQRYVDDVLRPVTLPYLQGVPNALYQQDNARSHTARISQQALQDVQILPWPPYSPDLSPIEHVWDIIGRRLHALP
ncbi:hypothetical protein LAZ67_12000459 [Cordylochernes scorpioides]|uniref:Transposase n=1 Tax=Cordylochernes scorpioides TaxID=51811 RepID=A0ABY6L433_9ARAC|nr:hypothetical protein LAZ67_12000459 [Cordylochernes scorpioides]